MIVDESFFNRSCNAEQSNSLYDVNLKKALHCSFKCLKTNKEITKQLGVKFLVYGHIDM